MMVKKVMQVTTTAVDATLAVPGPSPIFSIQVASGAAKAASPTMPLSMPMEVMPICTVERNCVGASISLSAAAAPASPVSASAARRARRLVERAISDIANTALSVVSKASRKTSMEAGREWGPMALYLIGDVQGCDEALARLLDDIAFSPSRDQLVLLGDLVNRGPDSLAVLRRVQRLDGAAQSVLGNHDLHLLGVAQGARKHGRKDTLAEVLAAPDREALLDWLRRQPMALHRELADGELLMVHAGVLPQWSLADTLALAAELESVLRGPAWPSSCRPCTATSPRNGTIRSRAARGCASSSMPDPAALLQRGRGDGVRGQGRRGRRARGLHAVVRRAGAAHGGRHHRLRPLVDAGLGLAARPDLADTGCVWGGCLSAVRIGATSADRELIQVRCAQAQKPG